ncbi:MAG TPA: hypothetical protein DIW26_01395 [Ruminococcus sp.]|nr:hypothetical protein [Ruminococcus sp.]HCR73090.1 hypothetical protein [Ruminococcus sp.]
MNYFCSVHIQSKKDAEKSFFIVLNNEKDTDKELPNLTKEILLENNSYKEFITQYKPKLVFADYRVYSTDSEIYASTQDDVFEHLIQSGQATCIGQSEINVDCAKDKHSGRRKKKKSSLVLKVGIVGGAVVLGVSAFGLGNTLGKSQVVSTEKISTENTITDDGMIIPVQAEISPDAEQITISVDRSYSAVPTEDLQLKGEVIDGSAQITLPEFDKTDFFTHVSGYTWGFTTDPDGKKIEYYGGNTYSFSENIKLYRVLVKYGGGSGTKEDPYLIDYFDQLELMGEEKARGYFKQTEDIVFPEWASHKPIDTVNELKSDLQSEYFEYDGNGYAIQNLDNPLFGTVSGAVIKNVNIQNSFINTIEFKDYGFIACKAYNYRYETGNGKTYETGETLIQHCSVSHSAIYAEIPKEETTENVQIVTAPAVVPPDLVEYDEDGNVIEPENIEAAKNGEYAIGAITGLGGQIENCYVTDFGVSASLSDYFLYVGGISGKPANVFNSVVYNFSAQGNIFNAGGIAGSCGGSRMYNPTGKELPDYYGGNIQGCAARKIVITTESSAGGIAGESSTDAENAVISNCYANELTLVSGIFEDNKMIKTGYCGGIIGSDGKEKNGHKIMNTVSTADFSVIGNKKFSDYDETIRLAPDYAFYQENILTVINKNTISPDNPKEIYTGNFIFDITLFGDENGGLAFPSEISDLFEKVYVEGNSDE